MRGGSEMPPYCDSLDGPVAKSALKTLETLLIDTVELRNQKAIPPCHGWVKADPPARSK
jgi:hypothetical protein